MKKIWRHIFVSKIVFTTDSTCDLTPELKNRFGVADSISSLFVNLGSVEHKDDGTFDPRDIYKFVTETKKLPKTAAANFVDFVNLFKRKTADGSSVIHFSISNELSATYSNALLASKEFENVYVVDGRQLSSGTSLLLIKAFELYEKDPRVSAKELFATMQGMTSKVQTSFCVDTITYLYKGGRCSALALLGANILKIHPSLHLRDGKICPGKKYRGKMVKVLPEYIQDLYNENLDYDPSWAFITYTADTDREAVEAALAKTKELFNFVEIHETVAGPTITSHCGKGTLGLLFMRK
jgi:DegV family protein with EDD domain